MQAGNKGISSSQENIPKVSDCYRPQFPSPTQTNSQRPLEHEFFIRYRYPCHRLIGPHQATEPDRCKNNQSTGTSPAIFPHTPTTKHPSTTHRSTHRLTVAPEREGVVPLPRLAAAGRRLVVAVALAETTRLLASGGEAAGFAVLL